MNSLADAFVCLDIKNILDFVANDEHAKSELWGNAGYCMSSPSAFAAIAQFPSIISAAASLHGVRLFIDNEDYPH